MNPLEEVAFCNVKMYADGSLSIDGNVGDVRLAQQMLEAALEAVKAQWAARSPSGGLRLPHGEMNHTSPHEDFPIVPVGDR